MATPAAPAAPATGATPHAAPHQASLYVGDLHPEITETQLFEVFKEAGQVLSIRVCRDHVTRRSLGYGYVNFQNPGDAERALETLNFHKIKDVPLRLMWSQRDPSLRRTGSSNVFIKNLNPKIDNQMLNDTFSQFGNILSCKVATDHSGASRGFGFVHFERDEDAEQAISKVHKKLLLEQEVFVSLFQKRSQRIAQSQENFTNCYIKGVKSGITEEEVKGYFSKYGEVSSIKIGKDGRDRAYCFCDFKEHEAAKKATEEAKGYIKEICGDDEGLNVEVCRHQKKSERLEELKKQHQQFKNKRINENAGNNLYIKNLDDTIDDAQLKAAFSKFGEMTSSCVMRDEKNASKGFGFVCFVESEGANKALAEMNGQQLGSKPLYVNVAQRKEVRRATLEIQYATRMGRGIGPGIPPQTAGPAMGNPFQMGFGQPQGYPGAFGQPFYGAGLGRGMPPKWQQNAGPAGQYPRGPRGAPAGPGRGAPGRGPIQGRGGAPGRGPRGPAGAGGFNVSRQARNMGGQPPRTAEALTPSVLAAMSADQQKNTMGDRLFVKINETHPDQAAKITGMLLEMDISEQLNLLEAPEVLNAKISEALEVLKSHST